MSTSDVVFDIKFGLSGLQEFASDWRMLESKVEARVPSQTYSWFYAYLSSLNKKPDSFVIVNIRLNGESIAIIPLIVTVKKYSAFSFNVLEFPEHSHFGLKDIMISSSVNTKFVLLELYDYLCNSDLKWDVINLDSILDTSAVCQALKSKSKIQLLYQQGLPCNTIPLCNLTAYFSALSKNFKRNLAKANNKLQQYDEVEFVNCRSQNELIDAFSVFLKVESSGWKGSAGKKSAIALNSKLVSFYKSALNSLGGSSELEINLMLVDGETIAVQYAVLIDSTVYIQKIGYDESYSKLQPGHILLKQMLQRYSERNFETVNLISNALWHVSWKPEKISSTQFYFTRRSLKGAFFNIMLRGRRLATNFFN